MAYVSPNAPLPRNSMDPVTADEAARSYAVTQGMEQAVTNAKRASASIAQPESFSSFGPQVVNDVRLWQAQMLSSAGVKDALQMPVSQSPGSAPQVLPLNVTESEYSSGVFDPFATMTLANPGMGVWGDATSRPTSYGWQSRCPGAPGAAAPINVKTVGFIAAVGLLYLWAKGKGR